MSNYLKPRKPVNVPLTPVQIRFIQAFSECLDVKEACKRSQVALKQATQFMKDANVRMALDDLVGRALEESQINASRVAEEFAILGFSNIVDIIEIGEDGSTITLKDLNALPRQFQACIQEISVVPNKFGNSIKVKMYDKMPALARLATLTNLDKKDAGNKDVDYIDAKAEELLEVARRLSTRKTDIANLEKTHNELENS